MLTVSLLISGNLLSAHSIAESVKAETGADTTAGATPRAIAIMEAYLKEQAARFRPHPILKDSDQRTVSDKEFAQMQGELAGKDLAKVTIDYPLNKSIFPPDMVRPTFLWHDPANQADTWLIRITLGNDVPQTYVLSAGRPEKTGQIDPRCISPTNSLHKPSPYQATAHSWTPSQDLWKKMQASSANGSATIAIHGMDSSRPNQTLSSGMMTLTTSKDPIGSPIFYRDVPLMPSVNESGSVQPLAKSSMPLIAWRLRDISKHESKVLMTDISTCANCHSFSKDGKRLGMDVDGPSGDKGAYAMADVQRQMVIEENDIITWNSYRGKTGKTIGFLSRISPDGKYAVSTVNESVFVANFMDHKFLQVFYPTRGILAYYPDETGNIAKLPGADDTQFVHCDPVWSPDGKWIVFARARARNPHVAGAAPPKRAMDPAETPMQYDLYRMPFNGGKGGQCKPIKGASQNGMSNTFPKISPDGKWIVFVKCKNGQLMRPDSELWIVPTIGGEARKMNCNTSLMNSWHSFSPNGKWMVFSSKANTPYTQMFLTHIDAEGNDSPAILIPNSTAANRATNLPEFVNTEYDEFQSIAIPAVDYYREMDAGLELLLANRDAEAIPHFRKALETEPASSMINLNLAVSLLAIGKSQEAIKHAQIALKSNPRMRQAWLTLGKARQTIGDNPGALQAFTKCVEQDPYYARSYIPRGQLLVEMDRPKEAFADYNKSIELDPTTAAAYFHRGMLYRKLDKLTNAFADLSKSIELNPKADVGYIYRLDVLAKMGKHSQALGDAEVVCKLTPNDPEAYADRGFLRQMVGDSAGAAKDFEKAMKLAPPNWHRKKQVEEAIESLKTNPAARNES